MKFSENDDNLIELNFKVECYFLVSEENKMSSRSSHSHGMQQAKKKFESALKGKTWAAAKKKKKQQDQPPVKKSLLKPRVQSAPKVPGTGSGSSVGNATGPKKRKKTLAEDEEEEEDDDDAIVEVNEDAEQEEQLRMENMNQKAKVVTDMVGGWDSTIQEALFDLLQDEGMDVPGSAVAASATDSPAVRLLKQQEREASREAAETVNTILTGYVNCLIPAFGMSYLID